jgi:large-conductance mechanosensitive channel
VATALAAAVAAGDTVVETLVVTLVAIVMALLVAGADLTTLVVQHSIVLQKQETTVQWHKVVTHSVTVLVTEMVAWVELLLGTEYD